MAEPLPPEPNLANPDRPGQDSSHWGGLRPARSLPLGLPLVLVTLLVWLLVTLTGEAGLAEGEQDLLVFLTRGIAWNIAAAGAIVLVLLFATGLGRAAFVRPLAGSAWVLWLPILYLLAFAAIALGSGLPPTGFVVYAFLNSALVGLSEEVMFRGLLYRALRNRFRIWGAVVLSTVAFGAIHVLNAVLTGDLAQAAIQALAATCTGFVLAAMLLRTGSLLWPILYHTLWDFLTFVMAGASDPGLATAQADLPLAILFAPVFMVLPNGLYGLWLIHRLPRHAQALARA